MGLRDALAICLLCCTGCLDLGGPVALAPADAGVDAALDGAAPDAQNPDMQRPTRDVGALDSGAPDAVVDGGDMPDVVLPAPDAGMPRSCPRPMGTVVCTSDPSDQRPPCNGCPAGIEVPPGFVCVPPGDYWVGARQDEVGRLEDDLPFRQVHQPVPFLIQDTELTQGAWLAGEPGEPVNPSYSARRGGCGAPDCPVDQINVFDVMSWVADQAQMQGVSPCYQGLECSGRRGGGCVDMDGQSIGFMGLECTVTDPTVWLCTYDYAPHCDGLRLPTEIEWEIAAVGAPPYLGRPPDELNLDEIAWYGGSHLEGSHPVAQKACNGFGLYDVIGNMSEWAHQPVARGGQPSRATHVPGALNLPSVGTVVRGGDFEDILDPPDSPNRLRLASRVKYMVGARSAFVGVRLVRTVGRPEGCRLNSECEAGEVCRWDADCLSATGRACLADDQCGHNRNCVEGFCT